MIPGDDVIEDHVRCGSVISLGWQNRVVFVARIGPRNVATFAAFMKM